MNKNKLVTDQGKNLKVFRKHLNQTQKEFAETINSAQSTVTKYENGDLAVPVDVVTILHKKHNMSYQWFFDNVGEKVTTNEKTNVVKDFATLQNKYDLLEGKFNALEKNFKKLFRDFYHQEYAGKRFIDHPFKKN